MKRETVQGRGEEGYMGSLYLLLNFSISLKLLWKLKSLKQTNIKVRKYSPTHSMMTDLQKNKTKQNKTTMSKKTTNQYQELDDKILKRNFSKSNSTTYKKDNTL